MIALEQYTPTEEDKLPDQFDEPGTVSLPDNSLYWVIKQSSSGINWTHQSGGFACLHPVFRGDLLAPDERMTAVLMDVCDYVYGKYAGYCVPEDHWFVDDYGPGKGPGRCFTNEDADHLDGLLARCESNKIVIDRKLLRKSCEAWIYANIDGTPCVIVTINSD